MCISKCVCLCVCMRGGNDESECVKMKQLVSNATQISKLEYEMHMFWCWWNGRVFRSHQCIPVSSFPIDCLLLQLQPKFDQHQTHDFSVVAINAEHLI